MCITLIAILFKVKPKATKDYQKLKENIIKELDKASPDDVPRVVISAASSLNFDNKTDSKSEQERKEVTKRIQYWLIDTLLNKYVLQKCRGCNYELLKNILKI